MLLDAPTEPNAVRSMHSYGLGEGLAEVRTFADFAAFTDRAGYEGLTFGDAQYPGAFAATRDLMAHITGPAYSRNALLNDACRGPGVMHFDQFAHAVMANRLPELTHRDEATQQTVRAQLIEPMLHNHWPTLPGVSAATGQLVAREIRSDLDAKVDELRRHYRLPVPEPAGSEQPSQALAPEPTASRIGARTDTLDSLRFLAAQAPPSGAVGPRLGPDCGARGPVPPDPRSRPRPTATRTRG
jgi:hypothetical protein